MAKPVFCIIDTGSCFYSGLRKLAKLQTEGKISMKPKMEEGGEDGHQDITTHLILLVIAVVAVLQVRMFLVLYTPAISIAIMIQ